MAHQPAGFKRFLRQLAQQSHLFALVLILILGMGFRLHGLDHKVYWHDEVFTSLRAAGYTGEKVARQLLNQSNSQSLGQTIITAADLQQFQQLSPDKTWADTWASLKTHPEHPPLFYLLERAWMGLVGSSVAATRGLSALFGICLFPLVAWFCNELSQGPRESASVADGPSPRSLKARGRQAAAVAIALLAVSPVQVLYAQEAREYSLWACAIILASGLFWRAMGPAVRHGDLPKPSLGYWIAYGGAIALGLYTTLLSLLVIIAHGLFLLLICLGQRSWSSLKYWLGAITAATLLFSPWIQVTLQASDKFKSVTAWTQFPLPLEILSQLWGLHLTVSFIDLALPLDHPYSYIAPAAVLLIVSLSWFAIPQRPLRWFLLSMLVVPALLLILPDVIQGGQRSSLPRYFMPLALTGLVTVALGLAKGLRSAQFPKRLACQLLLVGLLTAGTVSCFRSAITPAWWNKSFNYVIPTMAGYIAQAQQSQPTPVWIELNDNALGNAIALSHRLPPETPFLFFLRSDLPDDPQSPVLIPYVSGYLIQAMQTAYGRTPKLVETPHVYELWELD